MRNHKLTAGLASAMLLAVTTVSFADPKIGSAKTTTNDVQGTVDGQTHKLSTGGDVYSNETVRTGEKSVADLVFIDDTNLSVGPTSEVKLDKFVYDPNGSSGAVVIEATKGAFRFVTGTQDKRAYQIKTPFGTLGIRG